MTTSKKSLCVCNSGHHYTKSSDCPVCPICEENRKAKAGFLAKLSAPARRALENNNITTLEQLATYRQKEVLKFHGIGPASIPKLRAALEENGYSFKSE